MPPPKLVISLREQKPGTAADFEVLSPILCRPATSTAKVVGSPNYYNRPSSSMSTTPYVRSRRTAVSSESVIAVDDWEPPIYPKSEEESSRLLRVVRSKLNLLCRHSSYENEARIVKAMFKVNVTAGQELIRQGDPGDNFYIVESGTFYIYVNRPGASNAQLVSTVGPEGSFGELALMYNAPRAATVVAFQDGVVWGLDRRSFRTLLVQEGMMKKQKHEALLNTVTVFKCLTKHELCQLSDLLQVQRCEPGEVVIQQGTRGDRFYIVESGELVCRIKSANGEGCVEVMRYTTGGYFGELALISNYGVRKASVEAVKPTTLLWIGKTTFDRVLGPIIEMLKKNAHKYPSYADLVAKGERRLERRQNDAPKKKNNRSSSSSSSSS